jgi:hypothetical protein
VGSGSKEPYQFFDVSVAPHDVVGIPGMLPLQIVGKSVFRDPDVNVGVVMLLTLNNPNDFSVTFEANHVRIY